MITANELKIGNCINYKGEPILVTMVGMYGIQSKTDDRLINASFHTPDLTPIPLTSEILVTAGFEKRVDRFKSEYLGISIDNGIDKAEIIFYPDGDSKSAALFSRGSMIGFNHYYLHQVQNIYFDLTGGKELPINFKELTYL